MSPRTSAVVSGDGCHGAAAPESATAEEVGRVGVAAGGGDLAQVEVVDGRQIAEGEPAHLGELAVGGVRLTRDPLAAEDEIEVVDLIAVRVRDPIELLDEGEPCGAHDDARLLEAFAHRGIRRLLARVDDARHALPRAVVGASADQHLVAAHDHRGDPDERKRIVADALAHAEDEVGGGHGRA